MRIHFLQHVAFEGLAAIETWAKEDDHKVEGTRFYLNERLPSKDDFDALIVMGGPMSVHDENQFPWLVNEKRFVRETIDVGKKVLGICLGAQLIAETLGGKVTKNPFKEIGWLPVEMNKAGYAKSTLRNIPERFEAFHWHGETYSLPPGAINLARSEGCDEQAFSFGDNVLALQFHLEVTLKSAKELFENCRGDLKDGRFVQSEGEVLKDPARFDALEKLLKTFLLEWKS